MNDNFKNYYGIDEAGRGAYCGNVVVASVLFGDDYPEELNDSKKLTPKKREALYDKIIELAIDFKIVSIPPLRIDQVNILNATLEGMARAYTESKKLSGDVIVDGNKAPIIPGTNVTSMVGGDGKIPAIAAASILAKVTRDRQMIEADAKYPEMGYASHKGYGSKKHQKMMVEHGVNELYRRSYKPVKVILEFNY